MPSPEAGRRTTLRPWLVAAVVVALAAYVADDALRAYAVFQGQLTCLPGFFHLV